MINKCSRCQDNDDMRCASCRCRGCKFIIGYKRYEKLRRLNAHQFAELYKAHLSSGKTFDEMVDEL